MIKVINLVDSIDRVNFGIWNAAIATAPYLKENAIESYLWYPKTDLSVNMTSITQVAVEQDDMAYISTLLERYQHTPTNTIVVSHGCWQKPTIIASKLKKLGYKWVYVPHGMLEPWSMQKKWLKKFIYFNLIEKRLGLKADIVRGVGAPECINLKKVFPNVWLNQNGIDEFEGDLVSKWQNSVVTNYLFMARLHAKKGVIPLVKAWINSPQANNPAHHLYIAGPDDGELSELVDILSLHQNINIGYLGAVYGEDKRALLERSHIYLLPSFSEGFPTSVLEAMSAGALAVITDGCNFPEAIEAKMALHTTTDESDIKLTLENIYNKSREELQQQAQKSAHWIVENYSNRKIAAEQAALYSKLMVSC